MNFDVSKELLGMALLTVLSVLVVKGFYLDMFDDVRILREEVRALSGDGQQSRFSEQQLNLLRTRLKHVEMIKDKVEIRKPNFKISELPAFVDDQASKDEVAILELLNDEDNPTAWTLILEGSSAQLTAFLYNFENAGLPVVINEAVFESQNPVTLELYFEVLR